MANNATLPQNLQFLSNLYELWPTGSNDIEFLYEPKTDPGLPWDRKL